MNILVSKNNIIITLTKNVNKKYCIKYFNIM